MSTYDNQVEINQHITRIKINFKKDGASRKSIEYCKTRIAKLDSLWEEFKYNHDRLCTEESRSHQYFVDMWFEKTLEVYKEARELCNQYYQGLLSPTPKSNEGVRAVQFLDSEVSEQSEDNQPGVSGMQQASVSTGTNSSYDDLLWKQQVNIKALNRTIENIDVEEISEKWEFEDCLKSLQKRWDAVDKLHWEMEALSVPSSKYSTLFYEAEKNYTAQKRSLNKKMGSVSHREKSTPKLDIPIFSGSYSQWMSFKDLFDEAIHNNPSLSNAQKMQFLRSKIRGEAERLIQHLPISTSNYEVCWDILKHRYHNKKLIFTSHISLLLSIPTISSLSAHQIKKLHDVTQESLNAIKNLGVDISTWDPLLVHLLAQKLDTESYTDYVESLSNSRELPVLKEFLQFLEGKFIALESVRRKQEAGVGKLRQSENQQFVTSNKHKNNYQTDNLKPSTSGIKYQKSYQYKQSLPTYQARFQNLCPICNKNHGIYYCEKFLEMSNTKKCQTISQLNLCKNCLYSHNGKLCISKKRCRQCQGDHNTILHEAFATNMKPERGECAGNSLVTRNRDTCEVLLATALLKVQSRDGSYKIMRALIDQGSQTSIITERGAQALELPRQKYKGVITGIGKKESQCKGSLSLNCMSLDEKCTFSTDVYIMSNLIKHLPSKTLSKPDWEFLSSIQLADPDFYISRSVDLLLGAEIFSDIIQSGLCRSEDTSIVAQQTKLGWILCGAMTSSLQCNVIMNNVEQIERFWQVEDIAEESHFTSEDQQCIDYYHETTERKEDGKYVVRIPLTPDYEKQLGKSKPKAVAQFLQLERKLEKQSDISQQYNLFIEQYLELGHMKPSNVHSKVECYLPHHCVLRNESTTTSLRVVFNASAPTSSKASLNDVMMRGPNLQQDLMTLVLKWRQYKIAFTADIEKMFRQIWVHETDQHLQKIVWRFNARQPIQDYQLATVTYGTKAAPFLAMMTLKKLAMDEREKYPEAAHILETSFYMDDLLHGAHSFQAAIKIKQDLINLLKAGGFNLRKWSSNSTKILQLDQNQQENFEFKTEQNQKALGLRWCPTEDNFSFQSNISTDSLSTTKRALLSDISKLFDPLGWLSPVTTKLKLLFQEVWQRNIQWDEILPEDLQSEWLKIKQYLPLINNIKLSRWIYTVPTTKVELHGYSDATLSTYACTIYCKTNINNQTKIVLVAAKTRLVSKTKKVTLPKLELCGASLLATLMERVLQCLSDYNISVFGWCDSTAVLSWIQGGPDKWKQFVSNRVAYISRVIPPSNWHYVKSCDNPADCASRGITADQLQNHPLWWEGPSWLSTYRKDNDTPPTYETKEELKVQKQVCTTQIKENVVEILLNKYSNFKTLIRVLAWVRRIFCVPKQDRESFLTVEEIKQAKIILCKHVQQEVFESEINKLREKTNINSKSKILSLNPYLDNDGLLRVGGRLRNANLHPEMKNPIILPHDSSLTRLIIDNAHENTFHGGVRLTLSFLRQRYWIVGGIRAVKKRLRNCVTCKKHNPSMNNQIMGDLPSSRTNPTRPFYQTGVDFTGYVQIKSNKGRGIKTTKGYIAVFVCMVTKAVHLELVSDLTSSSFLAALRRMSARRGKPGHIYCDNGTNFVGANKILQQQQQINLNEIIDQQFYTEIVEMEIHFHFNAPAWPSAGGLWEAAVRSLKRHLKVIVGEQKFTFEELTTILSQIEACLNSRPLSSMTENPEDFNYLTPSHFLASGPILTIIETEKDQRTRWEYTQRIFREIWKRWSTEYLTQLSQRAKWKTVQDNIKINDLAMIHDANLPPGKWAMGRVVDTHPGKDGQVRVVTLKTKNGYIKRPIIKISVLPINTEQPELTSSTVQQSSVPHKTTSIPKKCKLSTVAVALLYFMAILSPIQAAFNITSFKKDQALYLDPISKLQLIRDKWTLVVYYDMSPYWEGVQAYEKLTEYLSTSCLKIENNNCNMITDQLTHEYNELHYHNNILLTQQFGERTQSPHVRSRRGLINGVGYLANSLFGVLDERFAEKYTEEIRRVKQNQAHLANLWKNRTSLFEAESNFLQRTEIIIQKHHKHINKQLMSLKDSNRIIEKEINSIATAQDLLFTFLSASQLLHNLKSTQDSLLDALTDIYHGQFQLHLLTPEQLIHELSIISGQVSSEVRLPIDDVRHDVMKIYKLIRVKARINKEYLLFEVTFPLISRDTFKIYQIIPVPQQTNKTMVTVVPVSDYISVNIGKDAYLTMTHSELSQCTAYDDVHLCPQQKPIYHLANNNNMCKLHPETKKCKMQRTVCQNKWEPLAAQNQFFYFCCNVCTIKIICDEDITTQQLSVAGIISLAQDCALRGDDFSLTSHRTYQNQLSVSASVFVPKIDHINHMINISIPEEDSNNTDFQELDSIIKQMKQQIKNIESSNNLQDDDELSVHDIHQYTGISLILVAALAVGVVFLWKRGSYGSYGNVIFFITPIGRLYTKLV